MAKKASGLGRGLGELLADNTPDVRSGGRVIKKQDGEAIYITPPPVENPSPTPKSLYEERPKNKSLKANFRDFNK